MKLGCATHSSARAADRRRVSRVKLPPAKPICLQSFTRETLPAEAQSLPPSTSWRANAARRRSSIQRPQPKGYDYRCGGEGPRSEHAVERMPFKKVSELKVLPEHVEALMPTQTFKLGRMLATYASGERAA